MTEANPQPSKENESLFIWKYGVGLGRIKPKIARLRVAIEERFLIRLSKLFHYEIQSGKKELR